MNDIVLRPWQKEDATQLAAIANNKNIWNNVKDSFPSPYTVMDALQWIGKETAIRPYKNFAVVYKGNVAGSMGIILADDVYKTSVEIGYFIGEDFWNKGIATQAIKVLCTHLQNDWKMNRISARVFEYNKASMKALQKAGFFLESIQRRAAIKNNTLMDVYVWVLLTT